MKGLISTIGRINSYRRVFENWLHVLSKLQRGEKNISVTLKDKSKGMCSIDCVIGLVNLVNNFNFDPLKFHFDNKGNLFYRNNIIIQDSLSSVMISAGGFIKKDNIWYNKKYNVKFVNNINPSIFETYIVEQYTTEIEGEVVDIGANIGDSAIYFALKGASHVYAFEPLPSVYEVALENIKINSLGNKITLINAAVGSKEGKVKVPSNINTEESGGFYIKNQGDVEVPRFSLNRINTMTRNPYLLKMDCEGCEADVIFSSELDFNKIFVESHQGITKIPHKKLIKRLEEQRYKCEERMKIDDNTKLFYCIKLN